MAKAPAFQFYVGDFLRGTLYFNTLEIGAYLLLLCHQWDYNFIPEDEIELVTRTTKDNLIRVLKKFKTTEHGLQNDRLEQIRNEQQEFKKAKSEAGIEGAKKRWKKKNGTPMKNDSTPIENHGTPIDFDGTPIVLPLAKNSSSSSTSSSTSKEASSVDVFEVMRRQLLPTQFSDSYIREEALSFVKKYKDHNIRSLGALIGTWVSNMKPDIQPKKFVN